MSRKLAALFFMIALGASAVLSGAPLNDSATKKTVCPMKCCKKKAESKTRQDKNTDKLCRTLNCTTTVPVSQSQARVNFVSLLVILKNTSFLQLLYSALAKQRPPVSVAKHFPPLKTFQPKYIQNLSLLI